MSFRRSEKAEQNHEALAVRAWIEGRMVFIELTDGHYTGSSTQITGGLTKPATQGQ
ncbi:MAG: hypothetical protein AB1403_17590 [Candidatus Riflebacteria bacterium]